MKPKMAHVGCVGGGPMSSARRKGKLLENWPWLIPEQWSQHMKTITVLRALQISFFKKTNPKHIKCTILYRTTPLEKYLNILC